MVKRLAVAIIAVVLMASAFRIDFARAQVSAQDETCLSPPFKADVAVVVAGWYEPVLHDPLGFIHGAYLVYWALINYLNTSKDRIAFLAPVLDYPDMPTVIKNSITGLATKENVRYHLNSNGWLKSQVDEVKGASIFIYFASHGVGYCTAENKLYGGRIEEDGDEGPEHFINGSRVGVDEGIQLFADDSIYWDDEMKADLEWLNTRLVISTIMLQSCYSEDVNGTCFSGGFIDDLSSKYRRTIITAANETGTSSGTYPFPSFTRCFMEALIGYPVKFWPDGSDGDICWDYVRPSFDWPFKTLRGAFEYALKTDGYYLTGQEHPWFDDDGNKLPNYYEGSEHPDFPWNGQELWRWLHCDVNLDGIVSMKDIGIVIHAFGGTPGNSNWNRHADVYENWLVDMRDVGYVTGKYGWQDTS